MKSINLAVPDDIIYEVKSLPLRDVSINDKLQQSLAIGMFISGEISLAKAAQLAKRSLDEFISVLWGFNVPAIFYTEDMLEDDIAFANKEF